MNVATALAGALLGAAAALPAARLAERAAHNPMPHPRCLRLTLAALGAVFTAAAAAQHGWTASVSLLVLVPATAAATVDAHEQRLPDPLTVATAIVVTIELAVLIASGHDSGPRGAVAFAAAAAVCLAAKATLPEAIGWGDVKLAPSLAALLAAHGWPALYTGLLTWSALVLTTAIVGNARRRPAEIVAYGPALVGGTACAIAFSGL